MKEAIDTADTSQDRALISTWDRVRRNKMIERAFLEVTNGIRVSTAIPVFRRDDGETNCRPFLYIAPSMIEIS